MRNKDLYAGFENVAERAGRGGKRFSFIAGRDIIDRMNDVFDHKWSSKTMFNEVSNNQLIMGVTVSAIIDDVTVSHDGYGGVDLLMGKSGASATEAGNPYKGAYTKALKDACKKFGVGLYIDEDGAEETPDFHKPATNKPSEQEFSAITPEMGVYRDTSMQGPPEMKAPASMPTPPPMMPAGTPAPPSMRPPTTDAPVVPMATYTSESAPAPAYKMPTTMPPMPTPMSGSSGMSMPTPVMATNDNDNVYMGNGTQHSPQTMPKSSSATPQDMRKFATVPPPNVGYDMAPPTESHMPPAPKTSNTERAISDVQKSAITTAVKNGAAASVAELVEAAFDKAGVDRGDRDLNDLNLITYMEALEVIRYSNRIQQR